MDESPLALKVASKIALAAMGVLFILGAIFYRERALFSDAAFRVFHVINYSRFGVPGKRYGAFIIQVLPYLARKLHLSINAILFLYGSSYNLFFFSVTALLVYRYRQYTLAILMALYYFLFVSESYMWVSETFLGVAWMFLFFAVTIHLGKKKVNVFLLLVPFSLFAFLALFSHFVIIIPTIFLWIYLISEKKNWPFSKNISILLSCILALILCIKFIGASSESSDSLHLHGITHFSLKDIINTFTTPVLKTFFYRCLINYWAAIIVFITSMVSLIKNKKWGLATWTFISVLGYLIIMGLTYGDEDSNVLLLHIESEWACIGILVSAGFVFTFLSRLRPVTASCLLAGIFIARLVYIGIGISSFCLRTDTDEQILAQMRKKGIAKLVLLDDKQLIAINKLTWGLPFETIMMSAIDGDKPQRTFCIVNKDDKEALLAMSYPSVIFTTFEASAPKDFNREYFSMDSTHPYQVMTYSELMK